MIVAERALFRRPLYFDKLLLVGHDDIEINFSGAVFAVIEVQQHFTIDNAAERVLVGMPYTSKLETMPIVIDPQDKAFNKKVTRVWFDLYKSGAMKYGNGADSDLTTVLFFENSLILDPTATATDFHTSRIRPLDFRWVYGSTKKQTVYIESSQPMPLTIRSITPAFKMFGN